MNPLKMICEQMGVIPAALASRLNCSADVIREAMAAVPTGALAAFIRAAEALGVKWRMIAGDPLNLWVDNQAIDALFADPGFRKAENFLDCPACQLAHEDVIQNHLDPINLVGSPV